MSLIGANGFAPGFKLLTAMGLLGAALIYGDGVITPAISVLSAIEGVNVVTASFRPFVMPMAVVILGGLVTSAFLLSDRYFASAFPPGGISPTTCCPLRHFGQMTLSDDTADPFVPIVTSLATCGAGVWLAAV